MLLNDNLDNFLSKPYYFSAFQIKFEEEARKKDIINDFNKIKSLNPEIIDLQGTRSHVFLNIYHLKSAIWHSWKAFQNQLNIAERLSVEFLLYLSGQRQINKALNLFGITDSLLDCALVIFHTDKNDAEFTDQLEIQLPKSKICPLEYVNTKNELQYLAQCFNFKNFTSWNQREVKLLESCILSSISYLILNR
ncbi:MAG: KEOPS complex subunit Cgi121 [Candidatus Hodarchaeales archaeon]|jgi:tRNA threonylcarbamoyladenosine modification (KEOPS) complex Cgi121 subunit